MLYAAKIDDRYILTEDPTYITNHKDARKIISRIDREALLRDIVTKYFE